MSAYIGECYLRVSEAFYQLEDMCQGLIEFIGTFLSRCFKNYLPGIKFQKRMVQEQNFVCIDATPGEQFQSWSPRNFS